MTNQHRYPGLGMGPITRAMHKAAENIAEPEPPDEDRPWFDDELLEEEA